MKDAPGLPPVRGPRPVNPRSALLLLPFYVKDPNGSFAKHALTPSLTFSLLAAATPSDWEISFWDENLMQGSPPIDPMPRVVGITVHLTFSHRAYEVRTGIAGTGLWSCLAGPHVLACPDEAAEHADVLAIGTGSRSGHAFFATSNAASRSRCIARITAAVTMRNRCRTGGILDSRYYLTTASMIATRGCHNRCGFLLYVHRWLRMPYQMRSPESVAAEFANLAEPYGVFIDNNLGSTGSICVRCAALCGGGKLWSAAVSIDVTEDPALVARNGVGGLQWCVHRDRTLDDRNLRESRKSTPPTVEYARRLKLFHDCGIHVNGSFVLGFRSRPSRCVRENHRLDRVREDGSAATFHIMTPYPGTPLFRNSKNKDACFTRTGPVRYRAHGVSPRHMTPEQLEQGYESCYRRCFRWLRL